jgi:hypothetical protein
MRRARVAGLVITAALGLLVAWIAAHTYWDTIEMPLPPRGAAATDPFYAAEHFVDALGGRASRIHTLGAIPRHAVLVVASWDWDVSADRRERIEHWVESGGRLVVDRSLIDGGAQFAQWSGIRRVSRRGARAGARAVFPAKRAVDPCRTLTEDRSGAGEPAAPGRLLDVCGFEDASALASDRTRTWSLRDRQFRTEAVRVPIGRGSVTLINTRATFSARNLVRVDHAALFVAATQLRRGDDVYFLTEGEQASLPALLWRLGAPAVALALGCLALALWRSSARLGPPIAPPEAARRSLAEQIIGTGRFVLRLGGGPALHAAMVRALTEEAERHVANYARLAPAERVAALARLTGYRAEALGSAIALENPRRRRELATAVGLIEAARRRLSSLHGRRMPSLN